MIQDLKIQCQLLKKLTLDHSKCDVTIELDRKKAIHDAIAMASKDDVVLICGKGADAFQKIRGVDTPYPSDIVVAQNVINKLEGEQEHFEH